jgi:hypothetical protein
MKAGPTRAEKEALRILAGCADGSTEAALAACGVKPATLDALVRAGLARTWVQRLHHPRVDVRWFARASD